MKPGTDYVFTVPRTLQEDPEGRQVHQLFLSAFGSVVFTHLAGYP